MLIRARNQIVRVGGAGYATVSSGPAPGCYFSRS